MNKFNKTEFAVSDFDLLYISKETLFRNIFWTLRKQRKLAYIYLRNKLNCKKLQFMTVSFLKYMLASFVVVLMKIKY